MRCRPNSESLSAPADALSVRFAGTQSMPSHVQDRLAAIITEIDRYGTNLNGPAREKVAALLGFVATVEAQEGQQP
jgi:hypothetical protein